ncbi:MAG: hypothetical protein JSS27_20265 [Planctomycetes bacterium]|nr:hypothetical protein [Planctomycetota bacterium]
MLVAVASPDADQSIVRGNTHAISNLTGKLMVRVNPLRAVLHRKHKNFVVPAFLAPFPRLLVGEVRAPRDDQVVIADAGERAGKALPIGY